MSFLILQVFVENPLIFKYEGSIEQPYYCFQMQQENDHDNNIPVTIQTFNVVPHFYHLPARFTASLMAMDPSCGAGTSARLPRKDPIGVRTALTMTTSLKEKKKVSFNIPNFCSALQQFDRLVK